MKIILRRRLSVPKPSWFLYIFKAQNTPYLSSYISKRAHDCITNNKVVDGYLGHGGMKHTRRITKQ